MTSHKAPSLATLLAAAFVSSGAWADGCISGDLALDAAIQTAALFGALEQNLADEADLMITRSVEPVEPVVPYDWLEPSNGWIAERIAYTLNLTPHREHLLIYTQTEAGLCALIFDGTAVIASAARPGQTPDAVTAARLALSDALRVDARQVQRAGQNRGAAALDRAAAVPVETPDAAALRLADVLMLSDLSPGLLSAEEILILPTNDIGTVPFALLPLGKGMMIDVAPITVVPSAAALFAQTSDVWSTHSELWSRQVDLRTTFPMRFDSDVTETGAVIVGDPDASDDPDWAFPPLPGARAEALEIGTSLGVAPMIGEAATLDAVLEALRQPVGLIYFAAHGVSSSEDPLEDSFLALSGGRLTARMVQGLDFQNWPLVVLSACQTGLGRTHAGGTIGLSRAFVLAGASAVVSTLWNVDDAATKALMNDFTANLTSMRPSDALRAAILAARSRHPDDPALWAGVMLFGGLSAFAE